MDQVKTYLAVAVKYGFWIGCVLVLFGSLGVWWVSTADLIQQNESQTGKIKTAISSVSTVRGELDTLPNDFSHAEMQKLIDARQEKVLQSWELLYNRQRDILTWPVKELTPDFIEEFKDLIPMETHVNFPTPEEEEKETTLLTQYERYIKNVLPDIAKIAKAEWTAEFDKAGGMEDMGMGMGMEMDMGSFGGGMMRGMAVDITGAKEGPLVKWSGGSQSAVLSDLFPWRGRRPTTLEVYYSQENIWILKQILQIIADVNGDAAQPYQAKIHEIRNVAIGKSVKFGAGNTSKPGAAVMGGGMGMDMEMGMGMDMEMEMEMGGMGGGLDTVTLDPGDNRYVNASLEKISGAELRSALTSNSPSDASLAVAKRVPVMLGVSIDQRAINELLAACGSAQLMVQVNQVRVLPKSASSGGGDMMGMGGGEEMDMGGMGDMMGGMGGMMGGMGGAPAGGKKDDEFPLDMSVEIYGLIHIYNPPDPVKFGVKDVTEDTVIDGETETVGGQAVARPPAATTPPDESDGELPTPDSDSAPAESPEPVAPAPATPAPDPAAPAAPPVTGAPKSAAPVAGVPVTTPPAVVIPSAVP